MDDEESGAIKLKSCPRCLTPIRTSLRYSNVIKQQLCDIEKVKIRAYGHPNEMKHTRKKLQARLTGLKTIFYGDDEMQEWKRLERSLGKMTRVTVAVTENQVMFMEKFCIMRQKLDQCLLHHAPRNLSANILTTCKYEIMKLFLSTFVYVSGVLQLILLRQRLSINIKEAHFDQRQYLTDCAPTPPLTLTCYQ